MNWIWIYLHLGLPGISMINYSQSNIKWSTKIYRLYVISILSFQAFLKKITNQRDKQFGSGPVLAYDMGPNCKLNAKIISRRHKQWIIKMIFRFAPKCLVGTGIRATHVEKNVHIFRNMRLSADASSYFCHTTMSNVSMVSCSIPYRLEQSLKRDCVNPVLENILRFSAFPTENIENPSKQGKTTMQLRRVSVLYCMKIETNEPLQPCFNYTDQLKIKHPLI